MTIHRLYTRLQRLEQQAQAHEEGILHIWRLSAESLEEAFDRYKVDPGDFPQVCVRVWRGERVSSRLATPPAPCWVPRPPPAIADLERRLHEGLKQRMLPL